MHRSVCVYIHTHTTFFCQFYHLFTFQLTIKVHVDSKSENTFYGRFKGHFLNPKMLSRAILGNNVTKV